ncbi:MAG: hypothetical protein WCS80_03640 [Bacilli bacterium]
MKNRKDELASDLVGDTRLTYKPVKDTIVIVLSGLLVVIITLLCVFTRPRTDNSHVEIKYDNVLLWDKNDSTKNTAIEFPDTGSKVLAFLKTDGPLYLGEGKNFEFYGDEMDVTIYSDHSIQITKEESPRNVCTNMGRVYNSYTPLICLPNRFQTMIVNSSFPEYDN